QPTAAPRVIAPRRPGIEYEVEAGNGQFYIVTNEGARNFKVMRAPAQDPSLRNWREWVPHREDVFVEGVLPFKSHVVVQERREGLRRLRIADERTNTFHEVDFPEAAYGVFLGGNPQFESP